MTEEKKCCQADHSDGHQKNDSCHKQDEDHSACCSQHDHDEEDFDSLNLVLEDGTELHCVVLGNFSFENNDYIALLPTNEGYNEDILIYGFNEINESEIELIFIEDEAEFNRVAAEFQELYGEMEVE